MTIDGRKDEDRNGINHRWAVGEWRLPGELVVRTREEGAPAWWHGEEEASAAFLREVGVRLD